MRRLNKKKGAYAPLYIRPWRSRITQQIPILKNGGSNPFGRATKKLIALRWAFLNDAATCVANDVAFGNDVADANDVYFARFGGGIASL